MKLYTRLIDSGVFIFWESDEGNTSYTLKIRIFNGDNEIELVNLDISKGQNYYSFDRVGSGDYEIELNGYIDERLYQTETKKIKIISSVQKNEEQTDRIINCIANLFNKLSSIESDISNIGSDISHVDSVLDCLFNEVRSIESAHTDPETIIEIRKRVDHYNKYGY